MTLVGILRSFSVIPTRQTWSSEVIQLPMLAWQYSPFALRWVKTIGWLFAPMLLQKASAKTSHNPWRLLQCLMANL
jgi:hypothetical protein